MFKRHTPLKLLVLAALVALAVGAQPAHAIKVCTYNILNFPNDYLTREASFRIVMDEIDADLIVVQEIESWQATDVFCDNILNYAEPGKYRWMPFVNGPDTDNACFFKPDVLDSLDYGYLDTGVRYTMWYKFRPVGYDSPEAEFVIFSTHLKAGTASSDLADRLDQTTIIRSYCNDYPADSNFMITGDFNLQSSSEGSYQMLIGYQTDNDGRSKDPINTGGTWHDNYSLTHTHTQSPRVDGGSGTGGGMDDRFDFVLVSYALDDGDGLSYVTNSYVPFGNDSQRFNLDINDPPNQIVSAAVADALYTAADHIPVFLELQLPAKLDAVAELAFGGVLTGAAVEETLTVGNAAASPADDLSYSLAAPAGFTAPGGSFVVGAASSLDHSITVDTGSIGVRSGDLTVSSNDLDDPTWLVALSATVLDHASPSFDEFAVDLDDTLDFGSDGVGAFADETLYIYNEGYNTLQSLLDVYDVEIVGGDGRFSIIGGFSPQLVDGTPAQYAIAFDSSGSPDNTLYTAEITFSTRDDPDDLGGTALGDAVILSTAYVTDGTSVPGEAVLTMALGPGSPNPFTAETSLEFSLAAAEHALIEVYDVSGRLVATIADGSMPAGASRVVWDGRDSRGAPAASGIYFCRAAVGEWHEARKVVLLQ
ncbi:MAG: choice-of-anchor D domain-containing protein [Candidatus Eisenbacteria bacterium]